jgi:transposase InsO family protein
MAKRKKRGVGGRDVASQYKLLVVQERLKGTPEKDVANAFGVSAAAVQKWTTAFRKHGPSALTSRRGGRTGLRALGSANADTREHVVALKREHETWGTRRIRDVLKRFEALGVSEQVVRRILHDEGLIETPRPAPAREHEPRRFERAAPNQLWQSDIFTFRLRRAERLYACVFMDDHSRFVVGHSLAHHQKSALVMEAFERGIAAYGNPTEVLTDNGRQYTVWRGKTEFEELLARMGIHHIRSRPQHPQTLGKVERFWKTLWDEFLGRTVFAHVVDAQRRLDHFISHYNFQRPHQALDGHVPADRFFRATAHVRAEIERAVAANELRLALEQPPRKPFYVVGQLGDQRLSIATSAAGLEVHVGDKTETISLQEDTDGTSTAHHFVEETQSADPAVAGEETGSRRGGEESRAARAVGPVGREAGDERDRGRWDLARSLLPARDAGAQRDALGAGARSGGRSEPGRDGAASADQGARGQARTGGASAATSGAPALHAPQADDCWTGEDQPRPATEDDNLLDAGWAHKLALLDDDEVDAEVPAAGFDPDAGWRERGPLTWERKLAGENAPSDNEHDDEEQATDVHARAGTAERSGAEASLRSDPRGDRAAADGGGGRAHARDVAQPLPDAAAPRDRGADRGDHAQAGGAAGQAGARGGAGSGERAPASESGVAEGSNGSDRADDDHRRWDRFRQDAAAAVAGQEDEDGVGGSRTGDDAARRGDDDA